MTRLKKDGTPAKKPGRKPDPNKPIKLKRGRKGPRPHVWKCGADEYKHSMYEPWMKSKAQANFRKEEWNLTFEEYYTLWKDEWPNRGRSGDSMCMTRQDFDGPWDSKNAVIMSRKEHLKRSGGRVRELNTQKKHKIKYVKMKVGK